MNWIKLNRKIFDNKIWLEKPYSKGQAMVDLLLMADFETGTFACSLSFLCARWGWSSKSKVNRFLNQLLEQNFIKKTSEKQAMSHFKKWNGKWNGKWKSLWNTYLIVNYSTYQNKRTESETKSETESGTNKRNIIKEIYIKEIRGQEDLFLELWEEWLIYKKEVHKFNYSNNGSKTALNRLIKESDFKIDLARKMIDKAIENNWKGFFKLEQVQNYGNKL